MAKRSGRIALLASAVCMIACGRDLPRSRTGDAGGWTSHPFDKVDAAGGSDAAHAPDGAPGSDAAHASDVLSGSDAAHASDVPPGSDAAHAPDVPPESDAARGADAAPGADAARAPDASVHSDGGRDRTDVAQLGPVGASCTTSGACASGSCADGVCCATACTGGCRSCAQPGHLGTCATIPAGASPRQSADCPTAAVTTCGLDGVCDGAGACELYQAGTLCSPSSCSNNLLLEARTCDGTGTCTAAPAVDCTPYMCDHGVCVGCVGDADCGPGSRCEGGACVVFGGQCSSGAECASGFCVDGVCCNAACGGPCVSCALAGRIGTCYPVDAGSVDPHGLCVDEGAPSCGHDGTCDGTGACAFYRSGATCAATSCSGSLWMDQRTCDGAGTCLAGATVSCSPYACDPGTGACHNGCATPDDCAPGQPCANGRCGPSEHGTCSTDSECLSGFCSQGVCCASRCEGPCFSCALPGTLGTCEPVPHPDPADGSACSP